MPHLDTCISKVSEFFPTDWLQKYGFHLEQDKITDWDQRVIAFNIDLDNLQNDIFDNLNFSVLKGEYVSDNAFLDKLNQLISTLENSYITNLDPPSEEVQDLIDEKYRTKLIKSVRLAVNYYSEFTYSVYQKIKLSPKEYIFKYHEGIRHVHEEQDWENKSSNLFLFQLNISVAEHDHNLSVNENQIPNLFYISKLLTKDGSKPYSGLIVQKCEYLRNKLLLRIRHEKEHTQIFSLEDGKENQVLIGNLKDGLFDDWLEYIESHYDLSDSSKYLVEVDFEDLKNINYSRATMKELHRLIKYYKDTNRVFPASIKSLNKIRQEINRRWEEAKENQETPFDLYAKAIATNYAINNEFSLTCDDESTDIDKAKKLYDEVIDIQIQTGIKNFFPQTKFLKFLLTQLKAIYNKHEALASLHPCRKIIDECHSVIKSYETNVSWTEKNYNYVFQLPFNECCKTIKNTTVDKLFIASSFLLPLPKDKYIKEFQDYKTSFLQVESSIIVLENISHSISKVDSMRTKVDEELTLFRTETASVKDSVKDKEIKMMEMLAIFTALISFVAASLPTFKFFNTPLEAALFVFALSTSFAAFVFLLIISLRGLLKIKEYWKPITFTIVLVFLAWIMLISASYFRPISSFIKLENDKDDTNASQVLNNNVTINKEQDEVTKDSVITTSKPIIDSINSQNSLIIQPPDTTSKHRNKRPSN